MLILSGPTAAGKNTVGRVLAQRRRRCAVVDFDAVRAMFVQPHRAPSKTSRSAPRPTIQVAATSTASCASLIRSIATSTSFTRSRPPPISAVRVSCPSRR